MKIRHVVVLLLSACTVALAIDQQSTASSSGAEAAWQAMMRADTEFMADWAKREHILAVYPDSTRFDAMLSAAQKQADSDSETVRNFTGYRQALNHFTSLFNDAHFSVQMTVAQNDVRWPGFLAAYRGGHYEVYGGDGAIAGGQIITACDGQSLDIWVERLAPYESIVPALESTRSRTAPLVLRDVDSPFVPRPKVCTIGGYDVALNWETLDAGKFAALRSQLIGQPDPIDHVEPFGDDGVWITLNNIAPNTTDQVEAFNAVVRQLPELRSKRLIVIDERNNGGGPYNWFMAFLRSLYGATYTDYHARERLKIENVYRTTPEIRTLFSGTGSVRSRDFVRPPMASSWVSWTPTTRH